MNFGTCLFADQNGKYYFADSIDELKKQLGIENDKNVWIQKIYCMKGKIKMHVGYWVKGLYLIKYRADETPCGD